MYVFPFRFLMCFQCSRSFEAVVTRANNKNRSKLTQFVICSQTSRLRVEFIVHSFSLTFLHIIPSFHLLLFYCAYQKTFFFAFAVCLNKRPKQKKNFNWRETKNLWSIIVFFSTVLGFTSGVCFIGYLCIQESKKKKSKVVSFEHEGTSKESTCCEIVCETFPCPWSSQREVEIRRGDEGNHGTMIIIKTWISVRLREFAFTTRLRTGGWESFHSTRADDSEIKSEMRVHSPLMIARWRWDLIAAWTMKEKVRIEENSSFASAQKKNRVVHSTVLRRKQWVSIWASRKFHGRRSQA